MLLEVPSALGVWDPPNPRQASSGFLFLPLVTWVLPETTSCVTCHHCPLWLGVQSRGGMVVGLLSTRIRPTANKALAHFLDSPLHGSACGLHLCA